MIIVYMFLFNKNLDLKKENTGGLMNRQEKHYTVTNNPLHGINLLLSKEKSNITKKTILPSNQAGELTTYGIANMDICSTQSMVLNDCETALSEMNGFDGVLGFQHNFRLADTKYMFMKSLTKIGKKTAEHNSYIIQSTHFLKASNQLSKQTKRDEWYLPERTNDNCRNLC